jgi:galactokinase
MPYLGDYLGQLIAEITTARMQADLEAVRVAELYASHPLLRHLPVPHFRLPNVAIDIPVVIHGVERPSGASAYAARLTELRAAFEKIALEQVEREHLELSERQRATLRRLVDRAFDACTREESAFSVLRVADELSRAFIEGIRQIRRVSLNVSAEDLSEMERTLAVSARQELMRFQPVKPRLDILATTAEIREAGPAELLARLHLDITEEAFQWTVVEHDGRSEERLVPE